MIKSIKKHRYALTKNKFLNEDEYQSLEAKLKALSTIAPRDTLIITLALHTGARASELLNIRPTDLDRKESTVHIRGLKGSNDRDIPLPPDVFKRLVDQTKGLKSHDPVFNITYRRLCQIWQFYSPSKKNFHSLRHSFALRLYNRTKDIKLVQMALGHTSINNTMIYLNFTYSSTEMRRLIVGAFVPAS